MKARFIVILLALNAALLAAGYLHFSRRSSEQAAAAQQSAGAELSAWKAEVAQHLKAPPAIVYRTNAFNWSQLESTDYREYIANLRSVGCPENTIKDIILTDVMRLYAQRRGKFYQNGRDFKFWETDDKRHLMEAQLAEREKALASIDKELPAVLRELLGINYERELNKYFVDADEDNQRLAFLSEEKRDQALALRERFEAQRETAALTNADVDTLRKIDEDQDAAFGALLTADEKQQYELSMSPTADRLRTELVGFSPSEDEFKALFNREKAIDEAYAYEDPNDPAVQAAKAADQNAAMADFKAGLSPDRAAQLTKAADPEYQNLCLLTQRYDLPADASDAMLDMRRVAEDEKRQLLANKDIPADRMDAALKAIQSETEKAARQTLGEKAYQQYSQTASWLHNLGSN